MQFIVQSPFTAPCIKSVRCFSVADEGATFEAYTVAPLQSSFKKLFETGLLSTTKTHTLCKRKALEICCSLKGSTSDGQIYQTDVLISKCNVSVQSLSS